MPEETKHQFLGIIDEESNRLADLIEGLLDLSRLESGTVKLLREPMNISAVITQVSTALKPLAEKKNIQLNANVCENLPQFIGDESKILSAITNLVNNAVKFTPAGGQVSVSATTSGQDELVIRFSDSGIGIPKEALPKIFDRFYRVHHPGKQIPGTGLGLAIVKKIVTMHGGRIEVESEPNRGTTFTIFLPLAPAPIQEERRDVVTSQCQTN
jgi:two-component system phosphate regulon sensor histidine kinase PhoR